MAGTSRGIRLCDSLRDQMGLRQLPILALTAGVMEADHQLALAAGMDDYLAKPLRKEGLQEVVERWLSPVQARALGNHPTA